jgi:signal transduction histidine kinase
MGLRSIERLIEAQDPKRVQSLLLAQSRLLEMIATNAPLPAILDKLIEALEQQGEGMLCSILLVAPDRQHLLLGAAPSLSPEFSAAIADGVIGPAAGSCGTAVYRKQQVVVTDIAHDPLWDQWRAPALAAGLRACWSTPIFGKDDGKDDEVIGSFAIYYRQPIGPTQLQLRLIEVATHLAGIAVDRSRAEAQRESLLAKLANEKEELKVCVRARDEFIALASHELKTPLAVLRLKVETMMSGDGDGGLGPPIAVFRQLLRLESLATDLLEYIRINGGDLPVTLAEGDLSAIADEAVAVARPGFEREGRTLTYRSSGPIPGRWDAVRIGQVLDRLLANALRYGLKRPVELSVAGDAEHARIEVRDSGIGIAQELQDVVFDRFERGVSWRNYGGLGLGLWICKRIVTALGGAIRVESELGKGASFIVDLPALTAIPRVRLPDC